MKKFNKFMAVAMSAAMLATQGMPVFASSFIGGEEGNANLLAYDVTTVVVPTTLKVALNPFGYTVNMRYTKVADTSGKPVADTVYYTLSDGKYSVAELDTTAVFPAGTDYYTVAAADESTAQIVSLNYGIVNKSTKDMIVTVDIGVTQNTDNTSGKKPITFVGTGEEATAVGSTYGTEDGTAEKDSLNMFLKVQTAKALPTANTYAKATAYDAGTVYYERNEAGKYSIATTNATDGKVDTEANFKKGTYFEPATAIGTEIQAYELSDVKMEASDKGEVVFEQGQDYKAKAKVGYKLSTATYAPKKGTVIDFNTTQADLKDAMELTAIGGVTGFTLSGAMNTNTNWTMANTTALKFVPTYTISDDAANVHYNNDGDAANTEPYNQALLSQAPSAAATQKVLKAGDPAIITVNLGAGDKAATGVAKFVNKSNGNDFLALGVATYADGKITIAGADDVNYLITNTDKREFTITFDDETPTTVDVTLDEKD